MLEYQITTARHRTAWLEAGPKDGPLMVFVHGWPEFGLVWRAQVERFATSGFRCVAPDMRGYGGSSAPTAISAYALREVVADMLELHGALGGSPAIWIGHDWGSPVVWAMASHHRERCRAAVNLCVPYLARGFALPNLLPLVDRALYPEAVYPAGQWDYWLYYRERFGAAARASEADVERVVASFYRRASPIHIGKPALLAATRARGGLFSASPLRRTPIEDSSLPPSDFARFVETFSRTGFAGPNAWYMQDAANLAYAAEAAEFGRLDLPVLFLHGAWDTVCDTVRSRLAEPMREDCADLTETTIEAGHNLMLEQPDATNDAIEDWLGRKGLH